MSVNPGEWLGQVSLVVEFCNFSCYLVFNNKSIIFHNVCVKLSQMDSEAAYSVVRRV